jgi:hypothetical protein
MDVSDLIDPGNSELSDLKLRAVPLRARSACWLVDDLCWQTPAYIRGEGRQQLQVELARRAQEIEPEA